jgi:hypothetical protein
MDLGDVTRKAYLAAVLEKMRSPQEEQRLLSKARGLLDNKIAHGLISEGHAKRWRALLDMSRDELADLLLEDSDRGRELRHAHLFGGALSAREANRIRKQVLDKEKERLAQEAPLQG